MRVRTFRAVVQFPTKMPGEMLTTVGGGYYCFVPWHLNTINLHWKESTEWNCPNTVYTDKREGLLLFLVFLIFTPIFFAFISFVLHMKCCAAKQQAWSFFIIIVIYPCVWALFFFFFFFLLFTLVCELFFFCFIHIFFNFTLLGLMQLQKLCMTESCRREHILRFFGETDVKCSGCDNCDAMKSGATSMLPVVLLGIMVDVSVVIVVLCYCDLFLIK